MDAAEVGIVFLSGAGLPPWMWDGVRTRIPDRSTHFGPRPPGAHATLADHANAALEVADTDRFVIVAHSAGGMVAAKILGLQPDRVAGLLGVSCVVPKPGASFVGSMPFPNRVVLGLVMRMVGTNPPEKALRAQAAGLPEALADKLVLDFVPESQRYYRDPGPETLAPAHRGYVCTTRDDELPEPLQRSFARRLGVERPEELGTGHLPMLEDPDSLVPIIGAFVDSAARTSPG